MSSTGAEQASDQAAAGGQMAAFLDPGLDFSNESMTDDEVARYLEWCRRIHGEGNLDLVPFAEFFAEFDRAGLKRLRRHTGTLALPPTAAVLMWAHTYCVLGFDKGVVYEVIAARELGVPKAVVVEVLRVAGFFGGPLALNAAGELTLPYLRKWPDDPDSPRSDLWPAVWTIQPRAFEAGIDHSSDELLPGELDSVRDWYERVHGGLPASLESHAERLPRAFKMGRVRFERLPGDHLPPQVVALLALHTAAAQGHERSIRRAGELARWCGVDPGVISETVVWATVTAGPWRTEHALEVIDGVVHA